MSSFTRSSPISVLSAFDDTVLDALSSTLKWGGPLGEGVTLSYSFPWQNNANAYWQNGYSDEPDAATHYGFNTTQIEAARSALESWSQVANVSFQEVAESGSTVGDIRFAFSSAVADAGAWGWSRFPDDSSANAGDVWVSTDLDAINSDFSVGGYGYEGLIHEIGHSLGLKHPGNYSGDEEGPFLPADVDDRLHSIMSYNDVANDDWYDTQLQTSVTLNDETPMVYDIATIQAMYGTNQTYQNGNTLYAFEDAAPSRETIWDSGGTDTISVEGSSHSSLIDLTPGNYSSIQTTRYYNTNGISQNYDGTYNVGIAFGTIIENADGGEGDDQLIGNSVSNTLIGNGGDDILEGGSGTDQLYGNEGNDILDGGEGIDLLDGGTGDDIYYIDASKDKVVEKGNGGYDTVFTQINWTMINEIEALDIISSTGLSVKGNKASNLISGGDGNDTIDGSVGDDIIEGGLGADLLKGGVGADRFVYTDVGDSTVVSMDKILDFSIKSHDLLDLSYMTDIAISDVSWSVGTKKNELIVAIGEDLKIDLFLSGSKTSEFGAGSFLFA